MQAVNPGRFRKEKKKPDLFRTIIGDHFLPFGVTRGGTEPSRSLKDGEIMKPVNEDLAQLAKDSPAAMLAVSLTMGGSIWSE